MEKLKIIDPLNFQLPEPVDILDLHGHYHFSVRTGIFENFNLTKLKKVLVFHALGILNLPPLIDNAEKFTLLESWDVNFKEAVLVLSVKKLRENSSMEIGVPKSLESFEAIDPALFHHKDLLKVIFKNKDYFETYNFY